MSIRAWVWCDPTKGYSNQNQGDDSGRGEYSSANKFAHWFAICVALHHGAHGAKQVKHHKREHQHNDNFYPHRLTPSLGFSMMSLRLLIAIGVWVLAMLIMLSLAMWQLTRMDEKQQRLSSIAEKQQVAPLSLAAAMEMSGDLRDIPVVVTGVFDPMHALLLDNQVKDGVVGYYLLMPLQTQADTVLVNVGWLPAPQLRSELPAIPEPFTQRQRVRVQAVITQPSANPFISDPVVPAASFPMRIQQVEFAKLNELLPHTLLPIVLVTTEPLYNMSVPHWQAVVMPPEKHLGYAIQWFGLALAALVIGAIALFKRSR